MFAAVFRVGVPQPVDKLHGAISVAIFSGCHHAKPLRPREQLDQDSAIARTYVDESRFEVQYHLGKHQCLGVTPAHVNTIHPTPFTGWRLSQQLPTSGQQLIVVCLKKQPLSPTLRTPRHPLEEDSDPHDRKHNEDAHNCEGQRNDDQHQASSAHLHMPLP
jgi:hypothetical protein